MTRDPHHRVAPSRHTRPLELPWLVGLFVAAGLTLSFGWLAEEVLEGDTAAFDRHLLLLFRQPGDPGQLLGPPWAYEMLRDLTSLGSTVVLGLTLLMVVVYLGIARRWAAMVLMLVAVLGGEILSTLLKLSFERPRPNLIPNAPEVFTASFPSSHAMLSAITYLTIGSLLTRMDKRPAERRFFVAAAVFLTLVVGISRVALGVHWPTDVLAGWCVGRRGRLAAPSSRADSSDAGRSSNQVAPITSAHETRGPEPKVCFPEPSLCPITVLWTALHARGSAKLSMAKTYARNL